MTDWLGKPYYSLDAYLKKTFGEKERKSVQALARRRDDVSEPGRHLR